MRRLSVPLLLLLAFARAYAADGPSAYDLGVAAWNAGDVNTAAKNFLEAVRENPNHGPAHFSLGAFFNSRGDAARAEKSYRKAIKSDPQGMLACYAHINIGEIYRDKGDDVNAERSHRKAIQISPQQFAPHFNIGIILQAKNDIAGAEKSYRSALMIDAASVDALSSLGGTLSAKGDFDGAKENLESAIRIDPAYFNAYNNLAVMFQSEGDLARAMVNYGKATRIQPDVPASYFNLGVILGSLKDFDGAENTYRKTIAIDPAYFDAYINLGILSQHRKDNSGAMKYFQTAVGILPTEGSVHCHLASTFSEENDLVAAEKSYRDAINADPTHVDAHANLGHLLAQAQDFVGADERYRSVVKLDPQHVGVLYGHAIAQSSLGDVSGAMETMRRWVDVELRNGTWPFRLTVSNMDTNEAVMLQLADEARFATNYATILKDGIVHDDTPAEIASLAMVARSRFLPPAREQNIVAALHLVHSVENTTSWAIQRWDDCLALRAGNLACAYGQTWFTTWVKVMSHHFIRKSLPKYVSSQMEFTVGGSALGEQCFFAALGLGLRCMGYEVLCESLVEAASNISHTLSLHDNMVKFACESIARADLSKTGVLWLNDALWPEDVRLLVFDAATKSLPNGATIISYQPRPAGGVFAPRIRKENFVIADVSWRQDQHFYIWSVRDEENMHEGIEL